MPSLERFGHTYYLWYDQIPDYALPKRMVQAVGSERAGASAQQGNHALTAKVTTGTTRRSVRWRMTVNRTRVLMLICCLVWMSAGAGLAADWPMWRHDANRGAASPEDLPDRLELQWVRQLPPYELAWPNEPRLHFDASHEPVVMGDTLFLASSVDGSVTAFDTETGRERWQFYTEGPVRFAPVASEGRVYFGSDDGYLYCLDADSGALLWRVRGCPDDRDDYRHLGNNRLISFWPVRGGPVLRDGVVYFAAGIWPTLGVFILAVDAESGDVLWRNSETNYLKSVRVDHNVRKEAGLSPQGYLLVEGDLVLVPNGRSMPARFDRRTGEMRYYVQGYRHGDCRVTAMGQYAFVGANGVMRLSDGREVGDRWKEAGDEAPEGFVGTKRDLFEGPYYAYKLFPACSARSVLSAGTVYGMDKGTFYAYDLTRAGTSTYEKDDGQNKLNPARWDAPLQWKLASGLAGGNPPSSALIKAGGRLYGHAGRTLLALDLPAGDRPPKVAWEKQLDGSPTSFLAANGKLFVVTTEGGLYCYGAGSPNPITHAREIVPLAKNADRWTGRVEDILARTGASEGHCVLLGLGSGRMLAELLRQSDLRVIAVDPDTARVHAMRDRLMAAGLYGTRVEVLVGDPAEFHFPPYLASLMVTEAGIGPAMSPAKLFEILRPYGGVACLTMARGQQESFANRAADAQLPNAEIEHAGEYLIVRRVGPLPGSAAWTHESADAARSYCSTDQRVQAPLGVLWYGDGAGYGFYKQKDYGKGVKPQVIGGRLFAIQLFSNTLHAIDVYTGRLLWQTDVDPFTRYASMEDGIYVAGGDSCVVYDPATGEPRATFPYESGAGEAQFVSDIRVAGDVILIAIAPEKVRVIEEGLWDSTALVALDRRTGQQLWTRKAGERFNSHAIALGDGATFCVDSRSGIIDDKSQRRGDPPDQAPSTIMALDARTGDERWSLVTTNPFRTYAPGGGWLSMRGNDDWLAYCSELNMLLAGKLDQVHGIDGRTGREIWHKPIGGGQPIIVQGASFFTQSGFTFDVGTGERLTEASLFRRSGGCNYAVVGEHLAFLRDRSVLYVEKATGEKHYLRNIRSGCSNSLVAADGLLNAPCFSVRCVCNYPIQTSFAMVHMPEAEAWAGTTALQLPIE